MIKNEANLRKKALKIYTKSENDKRIFNEYFKPDMSQKDKKWQDILPIFLYIISLLLISICILMLILC